MLGGSAPSQTSGAPFRTESGNKATVWAQPAHQSDIFSRGYDIYSLFPGPGDTAETLCTPTAKTANQGNSFHEFVAARKVPDAFFSTKFSFGASGTNQFGSGSSPGVNKEISPLELITKSFNQEPKQFSMSSKEKQEIDFIFKKESISKRLSDEVVIIKREADEINKAENNERSVEDVDEKSKKKFNEGKEEMSQTLRSDNDSMNFRASEDVLLINEPDSTEFKISNDDQRSGDVTTTGSFEKDTASEEIEIVERRPSKPQVCQKCTENDDDYGRANGEKCNISFVDWSIDGETNYSCKKNTEKYLGKVESVNNRLTEKKCVKPKTPDSSSKNVNVKPCSNELSKHCSRTLPVPPHNGGCSRTTPVTFKLAPQQEPYSKSQSTTTEISPISIKKEPPDFQKYVSGSSFLTPPPFDSFFNPSALRVLDGQFLNQVPYSEPSSRRNENFLTSSMDHPFISPSQSFLSPGHVMDSPFLSPNVDRGDFNTFRNYPTLPKVADNYLINSDLQKMTDGIFLRSQGSSPNEERLALRSEVFLNSSALTNETKSKIPESNSLSGVNVTPCQVAEVTSASALLSPKLPPATPLVVKQEAGSTASGLKSSAGAVSESEQKDVTFTRSAQSAAVSSTVGVPLIRQRFQQKLNDVKMPSNNVPPLPVTQRAVHSPSINLPSAVGTAVYAGDMTCDNRSSANLLTAWPTQTHNPTLWQYSAPVDHPPFPPVGFQLVRDPITGHFLLIPASNIEALQRAILWPSYQPTPPQMIIPPISVQSNTPRLLLDTNVSTVDFLTTETIHHSAPQHRILIATENASKSKVTVPTMIKVESSECSNTIDVTKCDNNNMYTKTQPTSSNCGRELFFYPQRPSASIESGRRSQGTSPAPCLRSAENHSKLSESVVLAPSVNSIQNQLTVSVTLQDASNQTDLPLQTEKEGFQSSIFKDKFEPYTKITEQNLKMPLTRDAGTETIIFMEPEDDKETVLREIRKRRERLNIHISKVSDINIKKEIISPSHVDLSGLELLSNSIEQFVNEPKSRNVDLNDKEVVRDSAIDGERKDLFNDACEGAVLLQNLKNGFRDVEESKIYGSESSKNLGGLGLLCALAEQRFQEEVGEKVYVKSKVESDLELNEGNEAEEKENAIMKEKSTIHSFSRLDIKNCDFNCNYENEGGSLPELKRESETVEKVSNENTDTLNSNETSCYEKLSASDEDDLVWEMSDFVFENNGSKRGPGRPKKFKAQIFDTFKPKNIRNTNRKSKEMSPPVLEKETDYCYETDNQYSNQSMKSRSRVDILKPPKLTPSTILDSTKALELPSCEVNLVPIKLDNGNANNNEKNEVPPSTEGETKKRKLSDANRLSSSKKRKVGRPKKYFLLSGSQNPLTETIVAKKPKTKPGYLFQPARGMEYQRYSNCSKMKITEAIPPKFSFNSEKKKKSFVKSDVEAFGICEKIENDEKKCKKIQPKLKAEPKVKDWTPVLDDDNLDWKKKMKKEGHYKKLNVQKAIGAGETQSKEIVGVHGAKESKLRTCVLTTEHLNSENFPIKTLTAMGGLFYAGQLSAIRAPDVYGITIDGERGNRPHIYSREEILKDSILEIKPEKTNELFPGTRCCAYWSEQYRCLYPGTVSIPTSPDPELDEKFVNVEFDDGDSGRINIDDIRLLPEDFPIAEYDPNPLQSLCKRKRRISGTSVETHSKERKLADSLPSPEKDESDYYSVSANPEPFGELTDTHKIVQAYEPCRFLSSESERRNLKKKRREKLKRLQSLSVDGKKKHKKHRCSDEHRHHRHHKKHRKHKHRHGKRHESELKGEMKKRCEKLNERPKTDQLLRKKLNKKRKLTVKSYKLLDKSKPVRSKKKERTESVESRSKMAAFLPARQLWGWSGKGFRRPGAKGRARKEFYRTIQRGKERISVGDCAVFLSTGRPDRPFIGRIESMWESWGTNMIVKVKWFYHPEETVGCPATLEYPGALFESPHVDENDVQTISHKCEVLPLKDYTAKIGDDPQRYETIYEHNDTYYLAGYYDPTNTTLKMEPGVK